MRLLLTAMLLAFGIAAFVLNRRVNRAFEVENATEQPAEFVVVPERTPLPFWGSEDVEAVAVLEGGLYAAGGSGVSRLDLAADSRSVGLDRIDLSRTLPTRRAAALAAWRTDIAAGLDFGGLFLYREGSWSEVRTGFGILHVRDLVESSAGELWIGAREGLFRMGFAERVLTRLHKFSVRAVAVAEGGRVISGGETGLFLTQGGVTSTVRVEGAEPAWIDDVAMFDRRIYAVTPLGLFGEGTDGVLRSSPNGENVGSIAVQGDRLFAAVTPPLASLRRFDRAGRMTLERTPSAVRRAFAVADRLMADTETGLFERSNDAWRVLSNRTHSGSFGAAHVGALATYHDRLLVGFFDGGLAELLPSRGAAEPSTTMAATKDGPPMTLQSVVDPSSSAVWAVNAMLDAGGALHIASLRGAFRFDGSRFTPLEGAGAAFSLAQTTGGVAVGYGEGVLLPEHKLLSGFHGLPGNQATALASVGRGLLVGTPSGLGYVEGRSVRWRAASGEGKLPHPWVTAILPQEGSVLIGTYGGGLTRRVGSMSDKGAWKAFPETDGLKINTGSLIQAGGRVYAGTDGAGLFRLTLDGTRFERLKLSLPSMRITALFEKDGFLYIGTDEGLTRWPVERDAPQ